MQQLDTAKDLRAWRGEAGGSVGLVPTMGNLHAGHLALVAAGFTAFGKMIFFASCTFGLSWSPACTMTRS